MIVDLKPYAEYKESGLPWLGEVPSHWTVLPAFGAFKPNKTRNDGMKEKTVLSLSYGRIVIKPAEKLHGLVPESFETYQIVDPGDIVLRTTDLQNDHTSLRVGMVRDRGIITSAYLALRALPGMSPDYGFQFLNVWDSSKAIYGYGSGLRQNLDFSHFKRMPIPIPPPAEQAAIVRFLDWANGRLERTIRAKRKVIALLNEQKQAIIHRAVTRGLDPSVPFKPSGIDWTPEIPEDWNQYPLRRLAFCENSGNYGHEPSIELRELPVATTAQIDRDGRFDVGRMPCRGFTAAEVARFRCKPGDILVVKSSGSAANVISGKCGIVGQDTPPFVYSNFLARFVANTSLIRPRYLFLLLTSYVTRERVKRMVSTTTYPNLRMAEYRGALLPVPPMEEQERILESVGAGIASIDQALGSLDREITLLREYRTCLVADLVTGKLDVREAATRLPDEERLPDLAAADDEPDDLPNEEEDDA